MKILPKPEETAVDKLVTTWAIIEARPKLPALIAVASATELDDTEPIARGLARVAREAGKRTGYLYLGSGSRNATDQAFAYTELTISGHPSLREDFDLALDLWHHNFDVIVVDLPHLAACALGAHVARLAEGVVVGVYPGRKVTLADRELTALFGQLSASIIGIVKTAMVDAAPLKHSPVRSRSLTSRFFPVRQP